MSVKALQDYTFISKYARYLPEKQRRETWNEAVERVRDMHIRKYPQIKEEIEWAFEQVKHKRVLGSQRALQFGGSGIEKKNARLYNCCAAYCDRQRFFQEAFWLLLCGSGVGFSVQKHHIAKLPNFTKQWLNDQDRPTKVCVIEDSIEGWANALGVLISSFLGGGDFPEYASFNVAFDYSLIRPEGAPLSTSSGKAPGPKPLINAIEKIRALFMRCIDAGQSRLRPIDAYDAVMHAADAVLSGGVRRSASLSLFSHDDKEMAQAKTGNWFGENPQRGRSNNSALLLRDTTTKEEFEKLIQSTKEFGEPGFIWADSTEVIFNPCVEVALYPVDVETGKSGWEMCNLCEINGRFCKSENEWSIAARAAAIIGTCQAGYTDFSYLGEITEKIVRREALLGVSITGMMDNPDTLFDPKLQCKIAKLVLEVNEEIAKKININPTARATCLKPSGTTSCILGTASGIHPHHAKRYIRRAQANYLEPPLLHFKTKNDIAVEKSVWSANNTDEILSFCIEVPNGAKTNNDIGAIDLLKLVKSTQQNWIATGTVKKRCVQPWLQHNVSNTITIKDEWEEVADFIFENRQWFAGISLISITSDKDIPQMPFSTIYTHSELGRMYGEAALFASGLIVDGHHAFENNLWAACDVVLGIKTLEEPTRQQANDSDVVSLDLSREYDKAIAKHNLKLDWVRRAKQFADRYFEGDVKKTTYCLKDVNNLHYWCALQREYKDVDYTEMIETYDATKLEETSACAGGACSLSYA